MPIASIDPRMAAELDVVLARFAALHPYERAWEVEGWGLSQTDPLLSSAFSKVWTPTRIAKCSSNELETVVRSYGVTAIEEPLISEKGTSAWAVADRWRAEIDVAITAHDELFLGLAATMFWSRLRADDPSDEMIYDRLVDGEILAHQGKWGAACDCWQFFWESVRGRMPKNQRRAIGMKGLFRGAVVEPWAERYCLALIRASRDSAMDLESGSTFIDEYLTLFPSTGGTVGWTLQATKARLQMKRGRFPEGLARFEALVRENPKSPAPYRALAESLLDGDLPPTTITQKAAALVGKAVAARVDRDGTWQLQHLLDALEAPRELSG
jgi:hypothetical protein